MESYCKILIVEDEFLLRQGIKNLVHWEQEGFHNYPFHSFPSLLILSLTLLLTTCQNGIAE